MMYIAGIDTGPVVGITLLGLATDGARTFWTDSDFVQVTPRLLDGVLGRLAMLPGPVVIAIERFVNGPRAARSTTAKAGAAARDTFAIVDDWRRREGFVGYTRCAAEVKPWATDARLTAAGIEVPTGMRHAKDGARHALFCAVKTYGLPDPLSRRGRAA